MRQQRNVQNVTAPKKNIRYEYIRAFATIAVIIIHTFNSASLQYGEEAWLGQRVLCESIKNLTWWAVPCFLMLSGSLLLKRDRKIDLDKLYGKYILRMVGVLFTFGLAFAGVEIFFHFSTLKVSDLVKGISWVLSGKTWAHLWYVYCMIGIYVLLPVYKLIADHASNQKLIYILLILFVFGSLFPTLKMVGIQIGFYNHISTIYPFWFLVGVAHNRRLLRIKKKYLLFFLVGSSLALILASSMACVYHVSLSELFGYNSLLVTIQSICVFELFMYRSIKNNLLHKVLLQIADKSFGIYLLHMVFINLVYKFLDVNPFDGLFIVNGIILVVINLALSYGGTWILKKIPLINKIV